MIDYSRALPFNRGRVMRMKGNNILIFLFLFLTSLLSACKTGSSGGPYRNGAGYGNPATPNRGETTFTPGSASGFLSTGYQPLETWMDERFRVRYENMPLNMVFEQKPISDIRYQLQGLPGNAPLFFLISPSISRRELLKEISRFYGLDMRVEMVNGQPGYVIVTGRGPVTGALMVPEDPSAPAAAGQFAEAVPLASPVEISTQEQDSSSSYPRALPVIEEGTAVPLQVADGSGSRTQPGVAATN